MCLFVADTKTLLAIQVTQRGITEEFDGKTEYAFVPEFKIKSKDFLDVTDNNDGNRFRAVRILAKIRNESSHIQVKSVNSLRQLPRRNKRHVFPNDMT